MENILTPVQGSNQFIAKFGTKAKRKFKVKFATKVKIIIVLLLISSLYLNYKILRANYVIRCSAGGMFMSQSKCDDLATDKMASQELSRIQFINENQDEFNN